jgi:hypothetical protein
MRVLIYLAVFSAALVAVAGASSFLFSFSAPQGAMIVDASMGEEVVNLRAATTGIRWAGYSTTTYQGNLGGTGFKSANQICNANYAGSHWANASEIIALGTKYPWTQNAWVAQFYFDVAKDCTHWSDNTGTKKGDYVGTQTYFGEGGAACNNPFYLPCVYRP